jgi:cytochrome b
MNQSIRVWDIVVRFGHWMLAALFFTAYFTEGEPTWLHTSAGYGVLIVIAFRILWGFIGPEHARFRNFVYPLADVRAYLQGLLARQPKHYLGHNPAGGLMILLLLAALTGTAGSGMAYFAAEKGRGPVAAAAALMRGEPLRDDGRYTKVGSKRFWHETHEILANAALALVLVHIAGVVVASALHRENLVRAMVTGRKQQP